MIRHLTFALAAIGLLAVALPASAEIRKEMRTCDAGLCAVFLPELPLPSGWKIDDVASKENGMVILVPEGTDFHTADALIYGRAFYNKDKLTIEGRVEESNSRWAAEVPDAAIDRLADIKGAKSGSGFQLFQYSNPSQASQRAEIAAFGEDKDADGNAYGAQMVMTALDSEKLDANKAVLFALLKKY